MARRLTDLESERVIALMDDTVEKLSFLGSIAPGTHTPSTLAIASAALTHAQTCSSTATS